MKSTRNPQSAIALVFAALLAVSWRRWTSAIADSGRELDLPLRLLNGEWLYRDVHHLYPPFSPYFNALLYRLCGVHLDVLHASGIVCALLIVVLCYRIARRLLAPSDAVLATLTVIVWCVFKPGGNLIAPYSFAALYGTATALGALLCTLRFAEAGRRRELLGAGLLIGLAAITKQEFALAAAVAAAAAVIYQHRRNLRRAATDLACAALPALAIAAPVYGLMFYRLGAQLLLADCHLFFTHLPASLIFYNAQRTGLAYPGSSLMQMLGGALVGATAVGAMVSAAAFGERHGAAQRLWRRASALVVVAGAAALLINWFTRDQWDGSPLRALPLLLSALIFTAWRCGADGKTERAVFIVAAYSLAMLARVALRVPSGGAFGGFFLPTSLILIYYFFVRHIPEVVMECCGSTQLSHCFVTGAIREQWESCVEPQHSISCPDSGNRGVAQRAGNLWRALLGLMLLTTAIVFGVRFRANYNFEIVAPRGHFFAPPAVGPAYREALDFITANTARGESIVVLPEGSDLAFLTERRMPLRHQIMIPGLLSERDELEAVARLQAERVRYVLVVNRPLREFGAEAFGRDFYQTLGAWIERHYRLVKVCGGDQSTQLEIGAPQFFIKVWAKKD